MVLGIGYCVIISVPMSKLRLASVLSAGGGAAAACQQSYHLFLPPPGPSTSQQPAQSARDTRTDCCHPHFLCLHLTSAWSQMNFYSHYFGFGVQCNVIMYFQPACVSIAWVWESCLICPGSSVFVGTNKLTFEHKDLLVCFCRQKVVLRTEVHQDNKSWGEQETWWRGITRQTDKHPPATQHHFYTHLILLQHAPLRHVP